MLKMTGHRRLTGIPAEKNPIASEALVHHGVSFGRIESLSEPPHLILYQRIHRV
ncbi:hypothetical protein D9M72_447040 [compost metagenome]